MLEQMMLNLQKGTSHKWKLEGIKFYQQIRTKFIDSLQIFMLLLLATLYICEVIWILHSSFMVTKSHLNLTTVLEGSPGCEQCRGVRLETHVFALTVWSYLTT